MARLIQIGRNNSSVTYSDILKILPEPEKDIEQLDKIFAALISAGIPYIDDTEQSDLTSMDAS